MIRLEDMEQLLKTFNELTKEQQEEGELADQLPTRS